MGKYGMTVDNLLSAELVLASGEVTTASEDGDRDLFWAIRGGGGNFGVATWLEYRAHLLATVLAGPVLHRLTDARDVFRFYRDLTAHVPDEVTTEFALLHAPDGSGTKLCGIAVCHSGENPDRAEADVRPLRNFGAPVADLVQRMPYPVVNTLFDAFFPRGALNYWKVGLLGGPLRHHRRGAGGGLREPSDGHVLPDRRALPRGCHPRRPHRHRLPALPARHNLILVSQWTDPARARSGSDLSSAR